MRRARLRVEQLLTKIRLFEGGGRALERVVAGEGEDAAMAGR